MTWGLSYNGGPDHIGICPECQRENGDCTDGLCEECQELQPVQCPLCGEYYKPDEMEGSICRPCFEYERDEKRGVVEDWFNSAH